MASLDEVRASLVAKGEEIRQLKASKVAKQQLEPHVAELLRLKEQFKQLNNGIPYDPQSGTNEAKKGETKNDSKSSDKKDKKNQEQAKVEEPKKQEPVQEQKQETVEKQKQETVEKQAEKQQVQEEKQEKIVEKVVEKVVEKIEEKVEDKSNEESHAVVEDEVKEQSNELSKNAAKKLAKKEAKKSKKTQAGSQDASESANNAAPATTDVDKNQSTKEEEQPQTSQPLAKPTPIVSEVPNLWDPKSNKIVVFFSNEHQPIISKFVSSYLNDKSVEFKVKSCDDPNEVIRKFEPFVQISENGETIFGDFAVAKFLLSSFVERTSKESNFNLVDELLGKCTAHKSQIDQWLLFLAKYGNGHLQNNDKLLSTLDQHLSTRTFFVGYNFTLADAAVLAAFNANDYSEKSRTKKTVDCFSSTFGRFNNLCRWFSSSLKEFENAYERASEDEKAQKKKDSVSAIEGAGSCPPLEGAVEGEVCTRFPPEPSGYLHIGHAKAALLNNFYANFYKGRLIVRFDDTNPSKEKEEFEESILHDLKKLDVTPNFTSHTSDYFSEMENYARKLIASGLAYMDNTPQEQMREERGKGIVSKCTDLPIEESLRLFNLMCEGSKDAEDYCLRAKIDMNSENGTLRDPVLYRMNLTPHHKTGTRFKAYPTYDFACPIVDSIEGVTHAMRTTEYNDRDEQYKWIQQVLNLRPVRIQSFSRMNFVFTELSKRKLNWFVENKKVEGWNDPRFPTIQGVIRRGVSVPALQQFILSQGFSRRINLMEWDSFWSINKKFHDPVATRYMAVFKESSVPLTIINGPSHDSNTGKQVQLHPKNAELGHRILRLSNSILLEGEDTNTIEPGEDIVLMHWGSVTINRIEKDANGQAIHLEGVLNPNGDLKKPKKLSWVINSPDTTPLKLVEFDHLITKKKLEEGDDFKNFFNPFSRAETDAIGDPAMRTLKEGDVIQLERRGFFRCDSPYISHDRPAVLFMIPDGKTKAMSTLGSALSHR